MHADPTTRSPSFDKRAGFELAPGLSELLFGIHHNRTAPGNRFLDRLPRDEQKTDALLPSLDSDVVASIKQNQRSVARLGRDHRRSVSLSVADALDHGGSRVRGIRESAGALEHVRERTSRSFHRKR